MFRKRRDLLDKPESAPACCPEFDAAYLGGGYRADHCAVKHYRRRKRWLA
jgi:hypothetical protein